MSQGLPPRKPTIFSVVEFGALAYGIYASVSAFLGGIVALIMSSVIHSSAVSFNNFNTQNGLNNPAPDMSGAVAAIGVVFLIAGVIGFAVCVSLISRRRAEGAYDGFANGSSIRDALDRPPVAPPPIPGDAASRPGDVLPMQGRPGAG